MKKITIILVGYFLSINLYAQKRLISWPEEGAYGHPSYLASRWSYIETLPFDGVVIFLPPYQWHNPMTPGSVVTYQQLYTDSGLANLATLFNRVKHNYLMAWCNKTEFYNDAQWLVVIQNFRTLAKVAKDAQIAGIIFDNEQYLQPVWDYPVAVDNASTYTIEEYRTKVRQRGKQVMEAMLAEFPNIEVMTSHGPFWSEPNYNLTPNPVYTEGELAGSFFLGFQDAAIVAKSLGHSPKVIDGGELYRLRTVQEFEDSYQWRKNYIASAANNSPTIPVADRPFWAANTSISFGVYNIGNEAPMDSNIMRTTMERATNRCDDIVWLYSKDQDWYTQGAVSNDWIIAVRDGFNAGTLGLENNVMLENSLKLYPNPASKNAILEYDLLESGLVNICITDILGKKVTNIINQKQNTGNHRINLNIFDLQSGTYFVKINTDNYTVTKKLILNN